MINTLNIWYDIVANLPRIGLQNYYSSFTHLNIVFCPILQMCENDNWSGSCDKNILDLVNDKTKIQAQFLTG